MRRSLAALLLAMACGPESTSGRATTATGPTAFANEMLFEHNTVRGSASPPPSPSLQPLGWSSDVAAEAEKWAAGCAYAHDPDLGALFLGQNIAATRPVGAYSASGVFGLWASEADHYDYSTNTCDASQVCGHYTQIVWRGTTALGCAHAVCPAATSPFGGAVPPQDWDYWVCDYAPPGNHAGEWPY